MSVKIATAKGICKTPTEPNVDDYLIRFQEKRIPKPSHCQMCQRSGHLRWHGSYTRALITMSKTCALPVHRIFCAFCKHTFALLPEFVTKFHHYAKEVIRFALEKLQTSTYEAVANLFMEQGQRYIATVTLYLWRRRFVLSSL